MIGLTKQFPGGPVVLDGADLDVAPGSIVALLGPSGSGKTTLLRCIAGLETPEKGVVRCGDDVLTDGPDVVPPEKRGVGMVFQDWALFPHLDVGANVGFGLPRGERSGSRVTEVLEMVGLSGLERRAPGTLSGGQQQRVALARALAPRPRVLLLDEPFSNLDTALRARIRTEVHRLLTEVGITTVFVTHDQTEAFVLGDSVALVNEGRIVQHDTPAAVYGRPADRWVATFVGDANLVPGTADGEVATTPFGAVPLLSPITGAVDVLIRPEHLELADGTAGRAGGAAGTVELVEFYGHDAMVMVRVDGDGDGPAVSMRTRRSDHRRGDRVVLAAAGVPTVAWSR